MFVTNANCTESLHVKCHNSTAATTAAAPCISNYNTPPSGRPSCDGNVFPLTALGQTMKATGGKAAIGISGRELLGYKKRGSVSGPDEVPKLKKLKKVDIIKTMLSLVKMN